MRDSRSMPMPEVSSKNLDSRLVGAQAIAGALFLVFLTLHLSNTLLASFGPETYNSYQRVIRQFYQQPFFELLLVIAPLLTHVVAGLWLYKIRKGRGGRNRQLKYRLQTWAGFFLLLVVFGHMLATRGISYWYGAFAEFEGVSFSLWWMPAYFYPYYFLLFMAGLYHGTMGVISVLKRMGLRRFANSNSLPVGVTIVGGIGVMIALLAFGGVLFEIDDPSDNDYARVYGELLNLEFKTPEE